MTTGNKLFIIVVIIIIAVMLVAKKNKNKEQEASNVSTATAQTEQDTPTDESDVSNEEETVKISFNEENLAKGISSSSKDGVEISNFKITSNKNETITFEFDIKNTNIETKVVSANVIFLGEDDSEIGRAEYTYTMEADEEKHQQETCMIFAEEIKNAKVELTVEEYVELEKESTLINVE